jgi:hypothetical protein
LVGKIYNRSAVNPQYRFDLEGRPVPWHLELNRMPVEFFWGEVEPLTLAESGEFGANQWFQGIALFLQRAIK